MEQKAESRSRPPGRWELSGIKEVFEVGKRDGLFNK